MEPIWIEIKSRELYRDARLTIDFSNHAVTLDSQPVSLTAKEYLLLSFLAVHNCETFSRPELLLAIWGYNSQVRSRTLDVHLARLRKKLGVFGRHHLETIIGNGCRYRPPRESVPQAAFHASAVGANPLELRA
ncbi:MAG: winged helix-turn-helix domain-containing protein [Bryobacteraceae bacterium]|jgi:DNA-binding response OmpR family regulator